MTDKNNHSLKDFMQEYSKYDSKHEFYHIT